ncbi:hypothetical protein [Pseudomonas extremaustralis]|uniref:hypothetical protein n=1 Tax=Pseudomonas extremaustralis TaxID=359110 RepID=UPI002AA0AF45|nr:hypothetical protein [Pseudomonas extremaustralis]
MNIPFFPSVLKKYAVGDGLIFKRHAKKIIAIENSGLAAKEVEKLLFCTEKGGKVRNFLHSGVQEVAHLATGLE